MLDVFSFKLSLLSYICFRPKKLATVHPKNPHADKVSRKYTPRQKSARKAQLKAAAKKGGQVTIAAFRKKQYYDDRIEEFKHKQDMHSHWTRIDRS